jgi:hypothetical protein
LSKELKKINDEAIILSLLGTAKELKQGVYLWRFVGDSKHMAQVRIEAIRKARNDFAIVPSEGQDRHVQEIIGSLNFINVYVPESALLFRCAIKQTDAPFRYYLEIPQFTAQADRRKSLRLVVHGKSEINLNFAKTMMAPKLIKQHFHKACFDISSGGFSFYVSKTEIKFFNVTDEIPMVEVKTGNWTSRVSAVISAVREIEPDDKNGLTYKVFRISCSFTQIDQISRKYIEKFIFERIKDELHAINE